MKRSRAGMAKVKKKIYLTKPSSRHMWICFDHDDDTIGTWQPI